MKHDETSIHTKPILVVVRPKTESDADYIAAELHKHWHSLSIWSLGNIFDASKLPALIAWNGNDRAGHLTYVLHPGKSQMEVITLSSNAVSRGVGTLLLQSAVNLAQSMGCLRIFLTTTNDNLNAIGFYQKRGWTLAKYHSESISHARLIKPEIPLIGENNIPLWDELEY